MNEESTILLADDSENDLLLMGIAFKKAGIKNPLETVCNGEEAIAYLSGEGLYSDRGRFPFPVLLLLDLNMPMKNGFQVLEWLSAEQLTRRPIVVVQTASARAEDAERAFGLGANCYLVKPSTLKDLTAMVGCLCHWLGQDDFNPIEGRLCERPGLHCQSKLPEGCCVAPRALHSRAAFCAK